MPLTFLEKKETLKSQFTSCSSAEQIYQKIIELGKKANRLSKEYKTPDNLVHGCQSTVYLRSFMKEDRIFFEAESDALISAGLAALLTTVYSGETPESVLKCPPDYLEELNIANTLTPNRANGLQSIHLRMKQDALKGILS